jgi:D-glycero-alpha-D-manno-heptose-7-phosphate kinase
MSSMTEPTVRASAPLRISFVGGGTDFPHYYERSGGAVLSATIDMAAHVDATVREDRNVRIRSLDLGHDVAFHLEHGPTYDGVMDLPKAAVHRLASDTGIDLDITSDAPPGSGLGGSSALVSACVAALAALADRTLTRDDVATLSYAIEREDLGVAGGWQDQYAVAFGGFNLLEFSRDGVAVTPLPLGDDAIDELRAHLLLCYTGGVRTDLGLIDTQIRLYEEGREETIVGMKQLHEMAFEMRDAVVAGDLRALGAMLREAYESKKRMNPHIADGTPIQRLLDLAQSAGALGGKVCGAGGGGFLLIACEPSRQRGVREALEAQGGHITDFAFRGRGVEAHLADGRTWRPT